MKTRKKSYFARAFLHTAGQSAQWEINKGFVFLGLSFGIIFMLLMCLLFNILHIPSLNISFFVILLLLAFLGITLAEKHIDLYWQGKEGEKFVRDELEPLIKLDYHIFNDVPGEGFNIDFLVVGPTGVYVVEVKNPKKLKKEDIFKMLGVKKIETPRVVCALLCLNAFLKGLAQSMG